MRHQQTFDGSLEAEVRVMLVPLEAAAELDLSHRTAVVDEVGERLLNNDQTEAYKALLADPDRQALWAEIVPGGDLRRFLATLLNFPGLRDQIPAIISALNQGDPSQLVAIRAALEDELDQLSRYPQSSPALPLVVLMSASENNGRRELTKDDVEAEARGALFTSPLPGLLVGASVPLYDRDAYYGLSPEVVPRTLVIHGTLDPNTPYEGAVAHAAKLAEAGEVTFATVTSGAHMLPFAAPECFVRIVSAFKTATQAPSSCDARSPAGH